MTETAEKSDGCTAARAAHHRTSRIKILWEYLILLFFLVVVLAVKSPTLSAPAYWDEIEYSVPLARLILNNNFNPFIGEAMIHPPLLYEILAANLYLFGTSYVAMRAAIAVFAFLAVFFTYLLGREIYNKKVGIIAALLLLFTPLFFAQGGLLLDGVPAAALAIMSFYFLYKKSNIAYLVSATALVLVKEIGVLFVVGLFLAYFVKNYKTSFLNMLDTLSLIIFPVAAFVLWLAMNKLYFGWHISPILMRANVSSISFAYASLNLLRILKLVLFDNFHWVLTAIALLCATSVNSLKRLIWNKINILYFMLALGLLFLLNDKIFIINAVQSIYYFSNFAAYADTVYDYKFYFAFLLFFALVVKSELKTKYINTKILCFVSPSFVFIFLLAFMPFTERYFLLLLPFYFIIVAEGVVSLFRKPFYTIAACSVVIILFVVLYSPIRAFHGGMETNMEYFEFVKSNKQASVFLERNYKDYAILVPYRSYLKFQLTDPIYGYVSAPLNTIRVADIRTISEDDFDLLLSDPFMRKEDKDYLVSAFDLTLIKSFNNKGKVLELYKKQGIK